ncbi:hypothetical protein [Natrinema sp. 74]|uniref:DUF7511 domain-containing protein n=1 Tax=Natrinema sp. 74 TaxID=3384159 RepID=UPI0038D4EB55
MTDADFQPPDTEAPITDFEHVLVENDDAPNECAIFPRDTSEDVQTNTWISAHEGSFVDLESIR